MENVKILIGDCRELLKTIPRKSVRLAVTSPPYNIGKKYGNSYTDNVNVEEWKNLVREVLIELREVLTDDGSFFLNVSPVPDQKTKEIIPLDAIAWILAKEEGYYLRNKIVWHFNNMQNCTKRLSGRWEAILWLVKDINKYVFNLKEVKIPVLTKHDKRFSSNSTRNPTDVWYFNRVNNVTKEKLGISEHPSVYPLDMIERIIRMASNEGDTVLDPFAGTGTTLVAATKLGRSSIGIEINPDFKRIMLQRLNNEAKANIMNEVNAEEADSTKVAKMSIEDYFLISH